MPPWAIVAGVVLESAQTTLAALAWFGILRAALPRAAVPFRLVLASYAAAVALNGFLPANIGTWVMLLMFTTLIAGATFALVFSGPDRREDPLLGLQRRPLPLPLPLGQRLLLDQARLPRRPHRPGRPDRWSARSSSSSCWRGSSGSGWRSCARSWLSGGAILRTPRRAFTDLFLPELGSYAARLGDRRRLPRRLRDPGHLPQRRHRHRLQLDLQQRLRHPRRRRRHPGDELGGALRLESTPRPPPPTRSASS